MLINMPYIAEIWSFRNLIAFVTFTLLIYSFVRGIYQLFVSPLSRIPGPWYAAVSDFWLTTHVIRLQKCKAIQALFDVYGPIVRVGPNKVVFCDLSSVKNVYTVQKFEKSTYYDNSILYVISQFEAFSRV